jgi:transketolase
MDEIKKLEEKARIIRNHVLKMIFEAESGHPGGSLSCVEIITALYFYAMGYRVDNPKWAGRDRFILSKGHATPVLYAALAEAGFFSPNVLGTLRKTGSMLQGHSDIRVPGVEVSSGSLGQGLSIANGIGLSAKMKMEKFRIFVLLGDGECDEGQIWEAAMLSSHYKLDNVTAIIDRNGLQTDGPTEKIMSLEPIAEKWAAFGWNVIEINGNQIGEVISAIDGAVRFRGKPTVIIAHTFKGKGVSFMEWINAFHGKSLTEEELNRALVELKE